MRDPVVLVTGSTGLLGPYLMDAAAKIGDVYGLARRDAQVICELADPAQTQAAIRRLNPDVVVHAAAYTDVDGCERDPQRADSMNRLGAANLAAAMDSRGQLVCISTDQVYPDKPGPHVEGGEAPVNLYGRTKLAGEHEILENHPRATVVRTNLFGPSRVEGRGSLSDFVIQSLGKQRPITLFTDVLFSPLHMATLARMVFELIGKRITGVFNVGSRDGMSKRDFGHLVAARFGLSTESAADGISTAVPGRAARPRDLRLDVAKIEAALGRRMPTCREEVELL